MRALTHSTRWHDAKGAAMTKAEARSFLNRVKVIVKREERIIRQIQKLEQRQLDITSKLTGMPRGSTPFTTEDYAVNVRDLTEELEKELAAERQAYKEVLVVLNTFEGLTRDILIEHYLLLDTWEVIAVRYNRTYRWLQELNRRAVKKIAENF